MGGKDKFSVAAGHGFIQYDPTNPDFSLKTAEADMEQTDGYRLSDFKQSEQKEEQLSKAVRQQSLQTMDVQLRTHMKNMFAYIFFIPELRSRNAYFGAAISL